MITFTQTVTVADDGSLRMNAPAQLRGKTVEAVLVAQPIRELSEETDANGYPLGFFEKVAGSITDPTFQRHPQGEYEVGSQ